MNNTRFSGGTKAGATTVATQLIATATPCRRLWIGPRRNLTTGTVGSTLKGAVFNTDVVFIGDSAGQNLPIQTTSDGVVIAIDDASKIWIRAVVSAEGVDYRILA
jgi:hypothetical protein